MLSKIIDYYKRRNVTLPQQEIDIISSLVARKIFKKKEYIHKCGDTDTMFSYVVKGCVRIYIKDQQNKEYNRFFAFEDWWFGEYHHVMNSLPSTTSAQALEKTEILCFNKKSLDIIFSRCPIYTKATLGFYLKGYACLLEKEELKKTKTIEELYLDQLNNHPKVLNRVPLYHVASYLGVKAESLSRVKKKFKHYAEAE